ncbi:MAG: MFS transporter [Clostridiales bacterium]|nr:MFS transporter [Clostridiales bacterium]
MDAQPIGEYKLYSYRWVVLVMYMLAAATIQLLWTTFFSITLEAGAYYGFTDALKGESAISLLSIIFMVGMIALSIPSMAAFEKFGYKKAVGFGVVLMAAAALVRGLFGDSYTMLVICTVGFGIAQPFILNAVGLVPGKWFPEKERALANGVGLLASYIGMMLGLLVTPILLEAGMDIKSMLTVYGVWGAAVGILFVLFSREAPPTPPCAEGDNKRSDFKEGIKILIKRPSFLLTLLAFFIIFGVFNTFFTLIEPILLFFSGGGVDALEIGIVGVLILVAGTIGSLVIPMFSDRSKGQRRKPYIIVCELLGAIGFGLFIFMGDFNGMIVAAAIYGLFCVGVTPVLMTFSAEVSYPVSEGTSEGMMMFVGNVAGVLLLSAAGLFGGNYLALLVTLTVLIFIGWILLVAAKETKLAK